MRAGYTNGTDLLINRQAGGSDDGWGHDLLFQLFDGLRKRPRCEGVLLYSRVNLGDDIFSTRISPGQITTYLV